MSSAARPHHEVRAPGVGRSFVLNLGVAAVSFAVGVRRFGYQDLGGYHPTALLFPAGVTALGSVLVGLVLLSQRPRRHLGAGILGGALVAVVVEIGLLALYVLQIIGDT